MTCTFRQGAGPKLECGLANTSMVFGEVTQLTSGASQYPIIISVITKFQR